MVYTLLSSFVLFSLSPVFLASRLRTTWTDIPCAIYSHRPFRGSSCISHTFSFLRPYLALSTPFGLYTDDLLMFLPPSYIPALVLLLNFLLLFIPIFVSTVLRPLLSIILNTTSPFFWWQYSLSKKLIDPSTCAQLCALCNSYGSLGALVLCPLLLLLWQYLYHQRIKYQIQFIRPFLSHINQATKFR